MFHGNGDMAFRQFEQFGVFLNTVTKGNFCWIQVAGKATVECETAAMTKATGAINDLALVDTDSRFENIAEATAFTTVEVRKLVGGGTAPITRLSEGCKGK